MENFTIDFSYDGTSFTALVTPSQENGVTIWLDCPFSKVCARVETATHRPLARDAQKFKQLYEDRRAVYRKADHSVQIDSDDPAAIVAAILKLPVFS